jgi:hypothetical protein
MEPACREVAAMTPSGKRRWALALAGSLLLASGSPLGAVDSARAAATAPAAGAAAPAAKTEPASVIPATTDSQREAAAIFERMARHLAALKTFALDVRAGYDVVQANGQKIEFGETRHVIVDRPDRMRIEEITSSGEHDLALFDGKQLTVFNADAGVYAQAPQPGSLDDALVYFVRDLRMRMPLAWFLTTHLPTELPRRVTEIDYVEETDALGVPAHHVAGRGEGVDFQLWIASGDRPLPLRIVLTYVGAPGQPQYWANLANWTTTPKIGAATFRFEPPAGARRISFAVQFRPRGAAGAAPAAKPEVAP